MQGVRRGSASRGDAGRWLALAIAGATALGGAWAQSTPPEVPPAAASSPAAAALPPAEHFARKPALSGAAVSPSGQRVAFMTPTAAGRVVATVVDLADPGRRKSFGVDGNFDVHRIRWVNDRRVVLEATKPGYLLREGEGGMFAVDHDGERPRQLVDYAYDTSRTGTRAAVRVLPYGWFVFDTVDDGGDDVMVYRTERDNAGEPGSVQLARLDTVTGRLRHLSFGVPAFSRSWVFDRDGVVRVVRVLRDGRDRMLWRRPGSDDWTTLEDREALSGDVIEPLALEDGDQLVVEATVGGAPSALYSYDLKQRRMHPEPIVAMKGFDIGGALERNGRTGAVLGAHLRAHQPLTVWFDAELAAVQKAVDDVLPSGRVNTVLCGRCQGAEHFVVQSQSDRHAGEYFHYDRRANRLRRLGETRPWLDERAQGRRSAHRVAARDGLLLPVVVTHPAASSAGQRLPAVVLVHGGPWLRGPDLRWSAEAQFLASRGWRVIEVDFRGSTGFGPTHFRAGWGQWGLAMQDDLADAVSWADRQGLIDPQRVCIVGASYGGYAALMAPIRHPGHWRCAASYAGVTDIGLMYSATWGDLTHQHRTYTMPVLVGDPVRDAARLRRTSPLHRAAEIKVPVLLAQGVHDRRVPPEHADRFVAAARDAGVQVERVDYDEGHTWIDPRHHADFLTRLGRFIGGALGPR